MDEKPQPRRSGRPPKPRRNKDDGDEDWIPKKRVKKNVHSSAGPATRASANAAATFNNQTNTSATGRRRGRPPKKNLTASLTGLSLASAPPPSTAQAKQSGDASIQKNPRKRVAPADEEDDDDADFDRRKSRRKYTQRPQVDENRNPIAYPRKPYMSDPNQLMQSSEGEFITRGDFEKRFRPSERKYRPGGAKGGGAYVILKTGVVWEFVKGNQDHSRRVERMRQKTVEAQNQTQQQNNNFFRSYGTPAPGDRAQSIAASSTNTPIAPQRASILVAPTVGGLNNMTRLQGSVPALGESAPIIGSIQPIMGNNCAKIDDRDITPYPRTLATPATTPGTSSQNSQSTDANELHDRADMDLDRDMIDN